MLKKTSTLLAVIASLIFQSSAQSTDSLTFEVATFGSMSSGKFSSFWIQNNRFQELSEQPSSATAEFLIAKAFQHPTSLFDYQFAVAIHMHEHDSKIEFALHQYYLHLRAWIFDAWGGVRPILHGNQDHALSSGGLLFSGNAFPVPQLFVGIENYTPVVLKNGFLSIKGGLSHGWFADHVFVDQQLYHHKHAAIRLGTQRSKIQFHYALDHVAQWGGIVPGHGQQPVSFADFVQVALLRSGSASTNLNEQLNLGGNHIVSQSLRFDIQVSDFKMGAYWQQMNEDKPIRPIWQSVNIHDGLWGFSVRNENFPIIKGLVYEYLNTTDQNGPYHDKDGIVYGGNDSYFNNYLFQSGWTHFGRTIGNPFLTSPIYNANGGISIQNNRVQLHHVGIEGCISDVNFRVLASFSNNYGTYSEPFSIVKKSANTLLELSRTFEKLWGINATLAFGVDWGEMYGNNSGIMLRLNKHFTSPFLGRK